MIYGGLNVINQVSQYIISLNMHYVIYHFFFLFDDMMMSPQRVKVGVLKPLQKLPEICITFEVHKNAIWFS